MTVSGRFCIRRPRVGLPFEHGKAPVPPRLIPNAIISTTLVTAIGSDARGGFIHERCKMISIIIAILVAIIVAGVAYWAIGQLGAAFSLPAPIITVAQVVVVILALVWIVQRFGVA